MTFSLIAHTGYNAGNGGDSDTSLGPGGIDTTGANLIIIGHSQDTSQTDAPITDSKSNTWTALTKYNASFPAGRLYYCYNPTVGSGHTFRVGSGAGTPWWPAINVAAFSGAASSPFDQQNGGGSDSGTSGATGSITPTEDNELVIALLAWRDGGTASIGSSFTILDQQAWASGGVGCALAYKTQTTAGAVNPSWSWTSSVYNVRAIASFKAAGGGGITGTLAKTNANDTLVAAGTTTIVGTLARTNANDTLASTTYFSFSTPPLKNNTGTLLTSETGVICNVYHPTTGALILHKTGLTSHASTAVVSVTDAALTGTSYTYEIVLSTNGRRLPTATAT